MYANISSSPLPAQSRGRGYPSGGMSDLSQLISHAIPNLSTTMPKRAAQNVLSIGIATVR
jgi:hypothetical protein